MTISKSLVAVVSLALAAGCVNAEDVLISKRALDKRQLNSDGLYNMSFFHINDVHAHLDEFRSSGTDCDDPGRGCYGGYARIKTIVDERRPTVGDSLFLNAGDEFQGTMYFTYYGGEKIAETINQLGFDGMTLGNHEFDKGDDELGAFLENLTFPIISANIQSDNAVLNQTIKPYHIYEEYNLAVIGATTEDTPGIASPGDGTIFNDVVESVQRAVDEIRSTTNITRIAALTHIGYEEDQKLAQETTGLYLIMGGHSHTPLGDGEDDEGPYPTVVENKDGEEVFVVTAWRWGEYLGYIDVLYDAEGKILEYHGGPIHVTNATEQDSDLQAQIEEWALPFEEFASEVMGVSDVVLDQSSCQEQECTLGNFMTDAMLEYRRNQSDEVDFAIINAGGIRATIDEGNITRGEVLTSFPFGNSIVELTMSGQQIWDVLEGIVSGVNQNNGEEVTSFFQVSRDIVVEYNPEGNNGSKLVSVKIGGEPIDAEEEYTFVTLDFLAGGGDNFFEPTTDFVSLDTQDEVLVMYIESQSPVNMTIQGRIVESDGEAGSPSGGNGTSGTDSGNSTGTGTGTGTGTEEASSSSSAESGATRVGAGLAAIVAAVALLAF